MSQTLLKKCMLSAFLTCFMLSSTLTWAQSDDGVWNKEHIARAVLTSDIQNLEPVDTLGEQLIHPGSANYRLRFFNQVVEQQGLTLTHLWFYEKNLVAEVELPIGSSNWRTYSSKLIRPSDTGNWRILVVNSEQEMLMEYNFTVVGNE